MINEEELDKKSLRCPKLGGEVPFSYCKIVQDGRPCERIMVCWEVFLDIEAYLRDHYTPSEIEHFLHPTPKDKMTTLIDIIEQAKKSSGKKKPPPK